MELTECSSCFDTLFHDAPVTASLGLGVTLNWTIENQLASYYDGSTTTSFVYDGEGRKGKKTVGNTTTIYVNKYYEKTGSTVTTSYYLGDRLVAQREGTTLRYIHQDDLTGTALTTASNDSSTGSIRYHPYGSTRSGNVPTDRKFTGQRLDGTGLYYYGARYYDPVIGRFISADTVVQSFANPQTLNRYSYVLNNPLRYVDPTGRVVEIGNITLTGDEDGDYSYWYEQAEMGFISWADIEELEKYIEARKGGESLFLPLEKSHDVFKLCAGGVKDGVAVFLTPSGGLAGVMWTPRETTVGYRALGVGGMVGGVLIAGAGVYSAIQTGGLLWLTGGSPGLIMLGYTTFDWGLRNFSGGSYGLPGIPPILWV